VDEQPARRVEVIEVGPHGSIPAAEIEATTDDRVVYRAGMSMADVERAAIEAALKESRGNRRKAAEALGIGERTLYRKLKEYALV
jgi:DNA-binding NtrC family response regulator